MHFPHSKRVSGPRRWRMSALAVASVLMLLPASLDATPFPRKGKNGKPLKWRAQKPINVWIQQDPAGKGRDQLLKEGIERWKNRMLHRGNRSVNVQIGDPPADAKRVVRVTFNAPGTQLGGFSLGSDAHGIAAPTANNARTFYNGGRMIIRNDLVADTDEQKEVLKNLGEHEFCHVLGLADDPKSIVCNHYQSNAARTTTNDRDKREINSLYGTWRSNGKKKVKGKGGRGSGGAAFDIHQYHFQFEPVDDGTPLTSQHVAMITLNIDPQLVLEVQPPQGWLALVPRGIVDPLDPFFSWDDYMVDGTPDPPPWEPDGQIEHIVLRASDQQALVDGLVPELDPALGPDRPELFFLVTTIPGLVDGPIGYWAGDVGTMIGPVIPEPASMVVLVGLIAAMSRMRRK